MNIRKSAILLSTCSFLFSVSINAQSTFPLQDGTVVELVSVEKGKLLTNREDDYTAVLSKFDLDSKTGKQNSTVQDYLDRASSDIKEWNKQETDMFGTMIVDIASKIKSLGLNIHFPDTIELIKSTMEEEGGAEGFTRSNCIYFKQSLFGGRGEGLEDIVIHEMFHVLSRYNPDLREKIYGSLGFTKCNEVQYPKEIADLRISNPDAPYNNYYITCNYYNKPVQAMFILYSNIPFKGGSFFFYVHIGLLIVSGDNYSKSPVYENGKPQILKLDEVTNLYEQIGRNTSYVFHPEEISADHFVMLLDQKKGLQNPALIEAMKTAMVGN